MRCIVMDESLLLLLVVICNGAFDAIVVAWLAGRRSKKALLTALAHPDEGTKEALNVVMRTLWEWLNTPTVELVGPLDEDGNATKIVVTPLQNVMATMIDTIVVKVIARLRGAEGKFKADANRLVGDLMGTPLPRKGQKPGDFVIEQLGARIMPQLQAWLEERLKTKGSDTTGLTSGGNIGF